MINYMVLLVSVLHCKNVFTLVLLFTDIICHSCKATTMLKTQVQMKQSDILYDVKLGSRAFTLRRATYKHIQVALK